MLKALFRKRGIEIGEFEIEEITLGTGTAETEQLIEDECTAAARALKPGIWVERLENGQSAHRAKLSWINPSTGVYLFTNRKGQKDAELTLAEVAAALRESRLRILKDTPLVDQAVDGMLKCMGEEPAGTAG